MVNHPHPPKSERIVGEWEVKQSARCPKQGEKWCGHVMRITKDQIRTYNPVSRDWVTYALDPDTGPTTFTFSGNGGETGTLTLRDGTLRFMVNSHTTYYVRKDTRKQWALAMGVLLVLIVVVVGVYYSK